MHYSAHTLCLCLLTHIGLQLINTLVLKLTRFSKLQRTYYSSPPWILQDVHIALILLSPNLQKPSTIGGHASATKASEFWNAFFKTFCVSAFHILIIIKVFYKAIFRDHTRASDYLPLMRLSIA